MRYVWNTLNDSSMNPKIFTS